MEGHELMGEVNRVKAPADFDERVFANLGEARRRRARRQAAFRYAFAGSAAVFLVGFVLLSQFAVNKRSPLAYAGKGGAESMAKQASFPSPSRGNLARSYLPVLETVDYSTEFRNASYQPQTVYILEQVSEVRPSEIKY
jgi:hypothetical protein